MPIPSLFLIRRALAAGAVLAALAPPASAQAVPPPIGGAQLQAWLDAKFSYAGLHHGSGCHLLNSADAQGRVLFLSCPNGWSGRLPGSARVQGDQMCTTFPIPGAPPGEECLTWHRVGDAKVEQRDAKGVNTTIYLLDSLKR